MLNYEYGETIEVFGGLDIEEEERRDDDQEIIQEGSNQTDLHIFRRAGKRVEYISDLAFCLGGEQRSLPMVDQSPSQA